MGTDLQALRSQLLAVKKTKSMADITRESGVGYLTLAKLAKGKAKRLSGKIESKLVKYLSAGKPAAPKATPPAPALIARKKPGPKPGRKPGRKPGFKPGPKPKQETFQFPAFVFGSDVSSEIAGLTKRLNYLQGIISLAKKYGQKI